MVSINTSLIIILIGAFLLMAGILFFKEPSKTVRSTCVECVAWGAGFFFAMIIQVALLAAIG